MSHDKTVALKEWVETQHGSQQGDTNLSKTSFFTFQFISILSCMNYCAIMGCT